MTEAIIAANVVDMYADANSSSERVSQAVSGAHVHIHEARDGFSRIETEDRYSGWAASERLTAAWDAEDYFKTGIATLFADVYPQPDPLSDMLTKLVVGTKVAVAHRAEVADWVPILLPDQSVGYVHRVSLNMTHDGSLAGPSLLDEEARQSINIQDIKQKVLKAVGIQAIGVGKRLIGTPYLWGGTTPFGIDCSGFVQLSYKLSGVQLLRDGWLQMGDRRFEPAEEGMPFDEADFAPADILGFRREENGRITHVGLALGDGRFIHSSGGLGVHIDPCHHPRYKAMFAGAVRISPNADLAIEAA